MSKPVYAWAKVSDLVVGLLIHIDSDHSQHNVIYRIECIETVGEDVIEIQAVHGFGYHVPKTVLHRKPTDEISMYIPPEGNS